MTADISTSPGRRAPGSPARLAILAVLLAVLAAIAHWPATGGGFLSWDDETMVVGNPALQTPSLKLLAQRWTAPYEGLYTPIPHTLWHFTVLATGKPSAFAFHVLSLTLHVLTVLLVFVSCVRITASAAGAFFAAAALAVHPQTVEVVGWISGIEDISCTCCCAAALLAWVEYCRSKSWAYYSICWAACLAAMLCKPQAAAMPLALATIGWLVYRMDAKNLLVATGFLLVAVVPVAILTKLLQPGLTPQQISDAGGFPGEISLIGRLLISFDAIGFYAFKAIIPWPLGIDYGRVPQLLEPSTEAFVGLILLSGGLYLCWRTGARQLAAGIIAAVLVLAPVSGLVWFNFQVYSTVADRYVYLSLMFLSISVAMLIAAARKYRLVVFAAAGIVLMAWTGISRDYSRSFTSNFALYQRALQTNPNSWFSLNNLAFHHMQAGDYPTAATLAQKAVTLRPDYGDANLTLGATYEYMGAPAQAVGPLERGVKIIPKQALGRSVLGRVYAQLGRLEEAERELRIALQLDPSLSGARSMLQKVREVRASTSQPAPRSAPDTPSR